MPVDCVGFCGFAIIHKKVCLKLENNYFAFRTMEVSNAGPSSSTSDLASLFECPVCFDYVLPPILQCQSGHLVCGSCRPKLTCCPTCRGTLGNIRNLGMEKVRMFLLANYNGFLL